MSSDDDDDKTAAPSGQTGEPLPPRESPMASLVVDTPQTHIKNETGASLPLQKQYLFTSRHLFDGVSDTESDESGDIYEDVKEERVKKLRRGTRDRNPTVPLHQKNRQVPEPKKRKRQMERKKRDSADDDEEGGVRCYTRWQ